MVRQRRFKCIICTEKPALPDSGFCHNCQAKIKAMNNRLQSTVKPETYITYHGYTVAMVRVDGKLTPKLVKASKLPKSRTINLDVFLPEFDKEQVKRLKKLVLRVACVQ